MAITLTSNIVRPYGFIANVYSTDWSGCETIVAGVAGKSIYIERIYINAHDTEVFTIGAGETGGSVSAVVLGPLSCPGDTIEEITFTRPLQIAAATALVVDAAGTGDATIIVQGFII